MRFILARCNNIRPTCLASKVLLSLCLLACAGCQYTSRQLIGLATLPPLPPTVQLSLPSATPIATQAIPSLTEHPTLLPTQSDTPTLTPSATPAPTASPTLTATPTLTSEPYETTQPDTPLPPSPQPSPTGQTPAPTPITWQPPVMGDLHIHTTCSDGQDSYESIVQAALRMGIRFIAITDHHFAGAGPCYRNGGCDEALCQSVVQSCLAETRLLCIPGVELQISTTVHLLGIGLHSAISQNQPLADAIKAIHAQGGMAIAAHPHYLYTPADLATPGLDAIECGGYGSLAAQEDLEWMVLYGHPCVWDSDAHASYSIGVQVSICSVPLATYADLKAAILNGHCNQTTTLIRSKKK